MKKNFISLLFVSAITVGLLSACSSAPADDNATNPKAETVTSQASHDTNSSPVSVTLNEVAHSIFYAPQYVAIENGYFADEGINLTLVTGFGADKVMTAVLSGEADIGFMGSESSIYTYQEGANDVIKNFAQLTQRAGNFLVAREEMPDFSWDDLKGKDVLGGRKGGMPEMVFEYILKKTELIHRRIFLSTRVLISVQPLLHFPVGRQTIPSNLNRVLLPLKRKIPVMSLLLSALIPAMSHTPPIVPKQVI